MQRFLFVAPDPNRSLREHIKIQTSKGTMFQRYASSTSSAPVAKKEAVAQVTQQQILDKLTELRTEKRKIFSMIALNTKKRREKVEEGGEDDRSFSQKQDGHFLQSKSQESNFLQSKSQDSNFLQSKSQDFNFLQSKSNDSNFLQSKHPDSNFLQSKSQEYMPRNQDHKFLQSKNPSESRHDSRPEYQNSHPNHQNYQNTRDAYQGQDGARGVSNFYRGNQSGSQHQQQRRLMYQRGRGRGNINRMMKHPYNH